MGRGRASVGGASRPAHSAGTGVPRTPPTSGKCRHTQGSQTHSVFLVKVFNDPFNTHRGYNEVHTLSNIPPGQSSAAALVWESSPFQLEEGSPTALHSGSLKREACRAPGRVVNNEWKTYTHGDRSPCPHLSGTRCALPCTYADVLTPIKTERVRSQGRMGVLLWLPAAQLYPSHLLSLSASGSSTTG
eukprot:gene779-422_t